MYAIKVDDIFGKYWKHYNETYGGYEQQFIYNGVEYLPLDECIKQEYSICAGDIEVIER